MKKFQNLSNNECLEVFPQIHSNSKILFKTGSLAANQENYGVASSLTILGAEEMLKSLIIFCNGMGIDVFKINELKGILTQHKNKHDLAQVIELIYIFDYIFSVIKDKVFNLIKNPKENSLNRFRFTMRRINFLLEESKNLKLRIEKTEAITNWWKNADNLKNRGLYVDYIDNLISPDTISKSEYLETKRMYLSLRKRCLAARVYLEISESRPEWAIVKDINNSIKLYQKGELF